MSGAVLSVRDVSTRRGGLEVLHAVSFDLGDELLLVVGLNGSGKSTLLRTISGLTPATRGSVTLRGKVITGLRCHQTVRLGVGFMPQTQQTFPALTVMENLRLGGYLLPNRDLRAELEHQLERLPRLRHRLQVRASALSGGERQMLALGKALMSRPDVLLLDEPSAGLSPVAVSAMFDVLAGLRADHLPILMVEQNVRRAVTIADRAMVMYLGRCQATVDPKSQADATAVLRQAMLGTEAAAASPSI